MECSRSMHCEQPNTQTLTPNDRGGRGNDRSPEPNPRGTGGHRTAWAIVDFAISRGDWISVRDTMRSISALKTSDECKQLFRDLVGLELGETRHDAKHDRLLFRAYQ